MENTKIWFTSDTHFNQERTLELSKRPFDSVQSMTDTIVDRWNNVVGENDIVYHLGDFGDYDVIERLNGKINLILGNYELNDIKDGKITEDELIEKGFYSLQDSVILDIDDIGKVYLTHKPNDCIDISLDDTIKFNLFGHIHKCQMVKSFGLNVGTDCHNFIPIDIDTVKFYFNAIKNYYDSNVFFDTYNISEAF